MHHGAGGGHAFPLSSLSLAVPSPPPDLWPDPMLTQPQPVWPVHSAMPPSEPGDSERGLNKDEGAVTPSCHTACALRSHDPGKGLLLTQVSHGKLEASGNHISVGGEPRDYTLLPRRQGAGGNETAPGPRDQFQACRSRVRSQGSVRRNHVCQRPSDGPGVMLALHLSL